MPSRVTDLVHTIIDQTSSNNLNIARNEVMKQRKAKEDFIYQTIIIMGAMVRQAKKWRKRTKYLQ